MLTMVLISAGRDRASVLDPSVAAASVAELAMLAEVLAGDNQSPLLLTRFIISLPVTSVEPAAPVIA